MAAIASAADSARTPASQAPQYPGFDIARFESMSDQEKRCYLRKWTLSLKALGISVMITGATVAAIALLRFSAFVAIPTIIISGIVTVVGTDLYTISKNIQSLGLSLNRNLFATVYHIVSFLTGGYLTRESGSLRETVYAYAGENVFVNTLLVEELIDLYSSYIEGPFQKMRNTATSLCGRIAAVWQKPPG